MRVVVAGGGVAGCAAALALARQGHPVAVLERDATPRPAAVVEAENWARRGVAQFHQPHAVLARLYAELAAGLPDVLDALAAQGVPEVPLPEGLRSLWCRRSTLEWVLRAAVETEPGISLVPESVAAVEADGGTVRGVRLLDGATLPADLVVDAGGRRGRLSRPWLAETLSSPADEVYVSRRYRLLPGARTPAANRGVISVAEADGYAALVFPHDGRTFSVCFTRLPDDDELTSLQRTAVFEAAARLVPLTAEWVAPERSVPASPVTVMGGLRNTFRQLDPAAPLGLHPLADAVCTTNPHFGRGTALAVAHALRLAEAVAGDPGDPRAWREREGSWVAGELRGWFDDSREIDADRARVWRAVRDGQRPGGGGSPAPGPVPRLLVLAAAGADPEVARVVLRHMHLVDPPDGLSAAHARVGALLARGWAPGRPAPDGPPPGLPLAPPRDELVAGLAAASELPA
ncbi:FAD-dependent oxidoreductase [Blastococcus sp. VKM Ac-2987]|uniref:FAD-dependent oxidoreductase n=1 Tax=Blastococcus sp. VKM Ac-2987 TaxID=3004141 RepID=UPI0022ABB6C5|nr:FAD-dependent oxidoreductase [Blastococcus sp. VKM Ac-2987]MCZ2860928.1 FAD-dependent oxidoreductase [Blastococcus sp. VKM Ac-2987]